MRDLDPILEERALNKFELTGLLIDSFLCELGKSSYSKLGRSRNTGLMPPVKLFVPYNIFRHICNVAAGYGRSLKSTKSQILVTIESFNTASEVFLPVRFNGHNFLKKGISIRSIKMDVLFSSILEEQTSNSFVTGLQPQARKADAYIRHIKIDVYGKRQTASEVFDFTTLL